MSYSYPYTAHLLDRAGESSRSEPVQSAIPQVVQEDICPSFVSFDSGQSFETSRSFSGTKVPMQANSNGYQEGQQNRQQAQQVQVQQQVLLSGQRQSGLSPPKGSENTAGSQSRKRKAKQPLQQEPSTTTTNRSEFEWARFNNMQEADAVFNSQQVRRANLQSSTLKSYDSFREHWHVSHHLIFDAAKTLVLLNHVLRRYSLSRNGVEGITIETTV